MLRRDLALAALGTLVCPPLASLVFLLATAFARYGLVGLQRFDMALFVGSIPFSYPLAIVPSLIVAGGNALVGRWTESQAYRLALALPIGAVPFLIALSWLGEDDAGGAMSLPELAALGFTGALVSLVSVSLVDSFAATRGR